MRTEYSGKEYQNESQKTVIIGDSMIENIKGWEISKKLHDTNVYVKHFSGAKVRCMKNYLNPSLRENPDHFVLHAGTNDLDSDRSPDLIAKSIVDVASSLKFNKHDATISNTITRNDRFMAKVNEVNKCLTELYFERNFLLIDHSKTLKSQHLNGSKLHLNRRVYYRILSRRFYLVFVVDKRTKLV